MMLEIWHVHWFFYVVKLYAGAFNQGNCLGRGSALWQRCIPSDLYTNAIPCHESSPLMSVLELLQVLGLSVEPLHLGRDMWDEGC